MSDRKAILETAESLINGERAQTYGDAIENFTRIGVLWGVMLDQPAVEPEVVAAMLAQLKLARIVTSPGHEDSWVDLVGYGALGGEIATAQGTPPEGSPVRLVDARTETEQRRAFGPRDAS